MILYVSCLVRDSANTDNKLELPFRDNLTTMYCFHINTAGIKILTVVNIAYAFFIPSGKESRWDSNIDNCIYNQILNTSKVKTCNMYKQIQFTLS